CLRFSSPYHLATSASSRCQGDVEPGKEGARHSLSIRPHASGRITGALWERARHQRMGRLLQGDDAGLGSFALSRPFEDCASRKWNSTLRACAALCPDRGSFGTSEKADHGHRYGSRAAVRKKSIRKHGPLSAPRKQSIDNQGPSEKRGT